MAEYIKYRGREVSIGTCESLYYTSYQKFKNALDSGFLSWVEGNLLPQHYVNPEARFRFRFPFPDEDKLKFGEIIGPFNRTVPVTVFASSLDDTAPKTNEVITIDLAQQIPVRNEVDGSIYLAPAFRFQGAIGSFSIRGENHIRLIVYDIVQNNIANEDDPEKKKFYRAIAMRMLKGCGLKLLSEYKIAVSRANKNRSPQKQNKGFGNKM